MSEGEAPLQVTSCEWIPLTATAALVRIVGAHRGGESPPEPIGLSVADGEGQHDYRLVAPGGRTLPPRPSTTDLVWMGGFSVPTALVTANAGAWSLRVGESVIELSPPKEGETGSQLAAQRDADRRRTSESEKHLWAARHELLEGRAALVEAQLAASEPESESGPASSPEPEAPRSHEAVQSELADLTSELAAERARVARLERQLTIIKGDLQSEREARREASARIARLGALALKAAQQQREGGPGVEAEVEELVGSAGLVPEVAEVVEPEPEPVAEVVEPEPEPVAEVVEPEPEPVAEVVEPEPEPVAEVVEPEPEPVAEVVEPEPVAEVVEPEPLAEVVEPAAESPDPAARRRSGRRRKGGSWLARALPALADHDPLAASQLMAQLLPAQALSTAAPVTYALTIDELGSYWISLDADSATVVEQTGAPRPPQVDFELSGDAATFAELFAGVPARRLLVSGDLQARGKVRSMRAVWGRPVGLAEAARAEIALDPRLVYKAIASIIDPEWTRGCQFSVAHRITGDESAEWYVVVDDGKPVEVTDVAPAGGATATVLTTTRALTRSLAWEPVNGGPRASFRGDIDAVRRLKTWTAWAQEGGRPEGQLGPSEESGGRAARLPRRGGKRRARVEH